MLAQTFWKLVVADQTDFLDRLLDGLAARGIRFCVLGGQGVNAYVDPVVSLDLDMVIATDQRPSERCWATGCLSQASKMFCKASCGPPAILRVRPANGRRIWPTLLV